MSSTLMSKASLIPDSFDFNSSKVPVLLARKVPTWIMQIIFIVTTLPDSSWVCLLVLFDVLLWFYAQFNSFLPFIPESSNWMFQSVLPNFWQILFTGFFLTFFSSFMTTDCYVKIDSFEVVIQQYFSEILLIFLHAFFSPLSSEHSVIVSLPLSLLFSVLPAPSYSWAFLVKFPFCTCTIQLQNFQLVLFCNLFSLIVPIL